VLGCWVFSAQERGTTWYSISIVVRQADLHQAIRELRAIGGSGVIVTPVRYIFEEEPPRSKALLDALQEEV